MRRRYCPDLAGDGAECDANYARLSSLLRNIGTIDRVEFEIPYSNPDAAHICIEVIQRCPYTTFLSLRFSNVGKLISSQWLGTRTMQIRMYHDLRTAEVISTDASSCDTGGRLQARYEYPNRGMQHPDEKSQMNSFLGEVLGHCLENGHTLDWSIDRDCELQGTR